MSVDEILRSAARELEASVRSEVDAPAALEEVERAPRRRGVTGPWLPIAAAVIVLIGLLALVVVAVADDDRQPVTSGERETTTTTTTIDGPDPGDAVGLDVTATPSTGLRDGDEVQVTVAGLPEGDGIVELVMCTGDALDRAPGTERCQSANIIESITPVGGRVESSLTVERILNLDMADIVDCAAPGIRCAIGVTFNEPIPEGRPSGPGPELVAVVGVAFAPVEALGEPQATVTPSEGLVHGEVVTLEGSGFVGSVGGARICAPPSAAPPTAPEGLAPEALCAQMDLGEGFGVEATTDEQGRFTIELRVWRMLASPFDEASVPIDCAEVVCTLEVAGEDGRAAPPVRLEFDGSVPAPPTPTLEISPTTGLRPGDPVTVTVRDLTPGVEAYLFACTLGGRVSPDQCGQATSLDPVVGEADGVVTLTIEAVDPIQYGQTCTEPGVCAVTLDGTIGRGDPLLRTVRPVPIQFAP